MVRRSALLSVGCVLAAWMLSPAGQDDVGERPYEMVRAGRTPPHASLVSFDSLDGWKVLGKSGATGSFSVSMRQRVWESPVARLAYRGTSKESEITLLPPRPILIPRESTAITLWIYGNNWGWAPDPSTPPVDVSILIGDRDAGAHELKLDKVRWKEWWLIHRVLPQWLRDRRPLNVTGIRISGCANEEEREIYLEDLTFFEESLRAISFSPRPRRGVDPFAGQDPGANTGEARLPFPTREETILPENKTQGFTTGLIRAGDSYSFRYKGKDCVLEYSLSARRPFFRDISVRLNGAAVGTIWSEAGPDFGEEVLGIDLIRHEEAAGTVAAAWKVRLKGNETVVEMTARIWQKSLVIDTVCRDGLASGLSYGTIRSVAAPELIALPYLNYGKHHLNVLMSRGRRPFFAGVWMDWYRSNASEPYAVDRIEGDAVRLNGGVRYLPRTDGKRNALFERTFLTVSPVFEETLPTIANPPARRGKEAGARLWQETWGPRDYSKEHARSRVLRAYGIEMLTQCNHEITWRDGGESFTFRTASAPRKGGDEALKKYIEGQKSLGWRSGLYTNYCDFAPVNEYWDPDMVMRDSAGDLIRAWPRCYSPKALFAVEMDRKLAPIIQRRFGPNAAYTDVHTSVSPWERCDYDARVPGAGTFAATFYAYGELLLHDQEVYDGHCWSEGHHQWLYAGLATGNYGLTYSDLRLWQYPYLPHFDLLKMHPLSVDIGMPWTAQFFTGKEDWDKPEHMERSIDQFLAATIAYGHIGWLVEEKHGIRQTARSYYMLQQLQSRYAMEKPIAIRYGTKPGSITSSAALLSGDWRSSRISIEYANGLRVWVNGNEKEPWALRIGGRGFTLPPFGYLALQGDDFLAGSYVEGGKRLDRLASPACVFLDGRGVFQNLDGIGTAGSVAVRRQLSGNGLSVIAIDGVERLTVTGLESRFHPDDVRDTIARVAAARTIGVRAYDFEGSLLSEHKLSRASSAQESGWNIPLHPKGIRYEIE